MKTGTDTHAHQTPHLTHGMTISKLRTQFLDGHHSPTAAVADVFLCIDEQDETIHAFLDVYRDATEAAEAAERILAEKGADAPPLTGVPIAVKNNILIAGRKATGASKILENYTATYDATVIARLREAGAIIVGSTNLDEFAMGSSTENSAFGPTKNPHDTTRVPGGSSGGSAAAVAMGAVPAAIGTDTGGSIRQPASFCGLVGFKPTYGAVSRHGLMAMGSSLDQAGPLTTTVADAELIFNTIKGQDGYDATAIADDTYPNVEIKDTYRIGVPRDFLKEGVSTDVEQAFDAQIEALKAAGHEVVDVTLPLMREGLAAYYIVMPAEVSSNLARYDGMRYGARVEGEDLLAEYLNSRAEGFGTEVKRRILLGTYVLSAGYYDAFYGKAEALRNTMRDELNSAFADVDLLITPTTPTVAFGFGEKSDPLSMYAQDIFTVPMNLTGVPAISLPAGTVEVDGTALPVGVQYIAPHAGDARLVDIGKKMYDSAH